MCYPINAGFASSISVETAQSRITPVEKPGLHHPGFALMMISYEHAVGLN